MSSIRNPQWRPRAELQAENARLREVIAEAQEQAAFAVCYLHSAKFHGDDWVCVSNDMLPKLRAIESILRIAPTWSVDNT